LTETLKNAANGAREWRSGGNAVSKALLIVQLLSFFQKEEVLKYEQ